MTKWTRFGVPAIAAAGISIAYLSGACSSNSTTTPPPPQEGGAVVACTASPGGYPAPNCDSSSNICAASSACAINEQKCGSKSTCLPMSDNTGKSVIDLRIRRLNVAAPAALANPVIQKAIVDQGINLKALECGEKGDGAFNWLVRVDKTAGTVTTGGSPPPEAYGKDPFTDGYCFVNMQSGGKTVGPVTKKITFNGNTFSSEMVEKLLVPIFVHSDLNNLVLLPLTNASFKDVTLSPDGNCVGSLNPNSLDSTCTDSRDDCAKWHTAGSLGGFITLEEADTVVLQDLANKSLCVLLVNNSSLTDGTKCKRDANNKIVAQGDFCSTTNAPGGCKDSFWLTATFAAAAVKINDGTGVAQCTGSGNNTDAGTDSGSADAATD